MYSQNNEEQLILTELERCGVTTGRFLDIGAWDGKSLSNTFRLAELGWSGVCVEASPFVFPGLVTNYKGNPNVTLVNAVVAPSKSELVQWYDSGGDAVSTTVLAHKTKWEAGSPLRFTSFWVNTMPVMQIFEKFGFDFDVISLDVESTNVEMFRALPWPALKSTKVICVEHDYHQLEMSQLASKYGFSALDMNGENLILTRQLA